MGVGSFVHQTEVVKRFDKLRAGTSFLFDRSVALVSRVVLQHLLQRFRLLRLRFDGRPGAGAHRGAQIGVACLVAHPARVHSTVLADDSAVIRREM